MAIPALFVSHGAPTQALDPGPAGAALAAAAARLPRPRAIVVASAHWDTALPAVGAARAPETIHDFYGFPPALYRLRYPAPGDAVLAGEVGRLLATAGLAARLDSDRGLDHGAWVPLGILYPDAGIPVVPLALQARQGPEYHFRLGRALAPLLADGVLVVGSGSLTHNLGDLRAAFAEGAAPPPYAEEFAAWIWERLAAGDTASLCHYRHLAPAAARAHPTDEHLLPLFVALGAAGEAYRAERLFAGIDAAVLAMDSYALWPKEKE